MIGVLPTSLEVDGRNYEIRTDFRVALLIFQAFNDPELTDYEKNVICLQSLYKEIPSNVEAACTKAAWFLDGGDKPRSKQAPTKVIDWEQDEQLMFPAINKVAGYETRSADYVHWWTFLGFFNEIGEGLWQQIMNIRLKKAKHKKLEKWEKEFYKEHKEIIDLKKKLSKEEQEKEQKWIDEINRIYT